MNPNDRIYIAGHRGMVGSAIVRALKAKGYTNLVTRTHTELELLDQAAVNDFFCQESIDVVFLAAAKVGGIHANDTYRADFIYRNLMIQCNVIHAACQAGVKRLLFLGSSCIYPRQAPQPIKEEHLLSGYLESTNEPYAIAKIAGIKLCESYNRQYGTDYRAVMPTNLYGPNDNFDLQNAHVIPALIRKFHLAKLALNSDFDAVRADEARFGPIPEDIRQALESARPAVRLWGTGGARREFLHVDDMAAACLHVMAMNNEQHLDICRAYLDSQSAGINDVSHINVGSGKEVTIRKLAEIVQTVVGYEGTIVWDAAMPDGMARKLMNVLRLARSGWRHQIDLVDGLRDAYGWYLNNH